MGKGGILSEPPPSYDEHAQRLNRRAQAEYIQWIALMSPADRRRVQAMGLDQPPADDYEVSGHSPYWCATKPTSCSSW